VWAKNGSLDFASMSACAIGAKANVPFVRWQIELKKCAVGKIKNTEAKAMSVGLLVVRLLYGLYVFGNLSKWFTFSVFLPVTFCRVVVFLHLHPTCLYPYKTCG